jgi:hypothetical protein
LAKNERGYDAERAGNDEQPTKIIGGDPLLRKRLNGEYEACKSAIKYFALDWDVYEDTLMVQSRTADNLHVRVSEGSLSSIVVERAARNMAQMPTGEVQALGLKNTGQSLLYQLLLTNWIQPNDNEQYDIETKLFLWSMYADVYGTMGMQYDLAYGPDYNGPISWLVPPRNLWPQQGRFSTQNSDYFMVSNFLSAYDFEDLIATNQTDYDLDCINQRLLADKDKAVAPASTNDYLRHNPMWQYRRRAQFYDTGQYEIITKYEAGRGDNPGRWISFFADYEQKIIRNIENPHQNGRIPIVLRYALPTLDSIIGLGAMEKGVLMQNAMDQLINMQIDYQKLRTYPPRKLVMQNVIMPTVRMQPSAKWGVTSMGDEGPIILPESDQSKNQTYGFLKAALNNVNGNTTTEVNGGNSGTPQAGKTPAAIKSQGEDESTIDALYLKFQQKSQEALFEGQLSVLCAQASAKDSDPGDPIELYIYGDEIEQIVGEGYEDIADVLNWPGKAQGAPVQDAKSIQLKIPRSKLKNTRGIKFKIDGNSSLQQDQEVQHEQLTEIIQDYEKNATSVETLLNAGGQTIDFPSLYKQWLISGGIKNWTSILKPYAMGNAPGQQGASNAGQGQQVAAQGAQAAETPSVTLTGKLGPTATAGAEQEAGLPTDPIQPQMPQQPMSTPQSSMPTPMSTNPVMTQPVNPAIAGAQPTPPIQSVTPLDQPDENYFIQDPEIRQAHAAVKARMQ